MIDYKRLNFRCGIEIHRQMATHKLFCSCPSILSNKVDLKVKRKLRSVASELGEEDIVAKYEIGKNKYAIYEFSSEYACLIELDEQPINNINEDALDTALIVAEMLNCKIVDEVQIMRKQVLDFSNTSGFQRTALIAMDGFIETSKGKVGIQAVCLEEDAARKIKDEEDFVVYRLDRLGIPLIEIATSPDIKDPEHAKEVAEYLGMALKSTSRFKAGLGTIRQDLNLSIKDGARVELKGVQDLKSIPKIIEKEVERQLKLIKQGKKVKEEVRRVLEDCTTKFLRPMPGASRMYLETDHPPIPITEARLKMIEIPELISVRAEGFEKKYKISATMAREIVKQNVAFDYYAEKFKIDSKFIASVLIEMPKEIKARYGLKVKAKKSDLEKIFKSLQDGVINKEAVFDLLADIGKGKKVDIKKFEKLDVSELEDEIKIIVEENKGASFKAVMGEVMKRYRGKVDGKEVAKILKKLL